nr:C39 family peptidase [Sedimentibacter sp.]
MAVSSGKVYFIRSYANLARYLDVYGNNQVVNGSNVITWGAESTALTQKWNLKNNNTNTKILSNFKPAFSLDHWNGSTNFGKCDMYDDKPEYDTDQLITLVQNSAGQDLYRIKLVNHNKFLTAATSNGQIMYWLAENNQNNQIWKFEEYVVPPFSLVDASSTVATNKYTVEYFSATPGAINITSKRVITPPSVVSGEKKISNMSLPFAQTSTEIQSINASYGSSCKAFSMAALLTFYSKKFISPHWFTQFGWVPPYCDNYYVTPVVTYGGKGAFKLVSISTNTTLAQLKTKIDAGIPVLLHCTGSGSGKEHWVAVYGYKGSGTAKSDFFVVDSANTTQGTTPRYGRYDTLTGSMSWSSVSDSNGNFTLNESYYMTDN